MIVYVNSYGNFHFVSTINVINWYQLIISYFNTFICFRTKCLQKTVLTVVGIWLCIFLLCCVFTIQCFQIRFFPRYYNESATLKLNIWVQLSNSQLPVFQQNDTPYIIVIVWCLYISIKTSRSRIVMLYGLHWQECVPITIYLF